MSKLTTLIRRAPKRFSAVAIMVAAAIIVPVAAQAWGPDRPTFTFEKPAPYVTFNSITNNPDVGDERNFVRIKEDGTNNNYTDNVNLTPGKVYSVSVYYHNNAATSLNESGAGIAKNTKLRMELPGVVKSGVNAALTGNISASNAKPATVYDEAYGKNSSNGDVALRYVSGSATVASSNGAVKGKALPDSLFTTGANLGYEALDGTIPGCNKYSGYVTFKFRVDQPNFTVKKEVSTDGKTWVDGTTKAQAGSTVQYRVTYQNTGTTQLDNVSLHDTLPKGVTYVPGSSLIANATTKGVYAKAKDGITTTGYNAGSYQPKGNVFFKFSAKVADKAALACGTNTLKNVVRATTSAGSKEDTATVTVDKDCTPPVVKKIQVCDLTTKKVISINEKDFNAKKHSKNLADCKVVPPTKIEVCEITTKKIVTINKSDYDTTKYTTDLTKCEDAPVTPPVTPETPPELPQTGAGENIVALFGLGSIVASVAYYVASRRGLGL